MFLEKLTILNFGLFRGSQTLNLAPPTPEKPLILIGGLNGSGKTTLLDAIQLALYGKRARLSNRTSLSYEEYLRRSINNETVNQETSVTLQFRRWSNGREQVFHVRRFWNLVGQDVVENVVVMSNGVFDRVLTDTWAEFVEEIIPLEIAQLFFFDGEKIEGFADPETSKQLLAKAVSTLLGLDVINRLQVDLLTLERRKKAGLQSEDERNKIAHLENQIRIFDERREDLIQRRAACQNEVDRRSKDLRVTLEVYNQNGGSLFDQREELERESSKLKNDLKTAEHNLREIAEGVAPFLLVENLFASINNQHIHEEQAAKAVVVNQALAERDYELLELVNSLEIAEPLSEKIQDFLVKDRLRRAASETTEIYLNLTPECFQDIRDLQNSLLLQAKTDACNSLDSIEKLQTNLVDLERKLAGVPAQDLVLELIARKDAIQKMLDDAENRLAIIDADIKRLAIEQAIIQDNLNAQLETVVNERFAAEDAGRIIRHSNLIRETMTKFRRAVVERHAGRIAVLVLDSFRRLLRKESLISDLRIDAETFAVELRDGSGKTLLPDRLSAGERQLLAVSLLWGLARASGYPLPVAVDTPLGRLDATHREKLVENYFPNASHQVILLSTNTEIDMEHFRRLEPFIGHVYRLEFDDQTRSTSIKIGYFEDLWQSNTSDFLSKQKSNSLN